MKLLLGRYVWCVQMMGLVRAHGIDSYTEVPYAATASRIAGVGLTLGIADERQDGGGSGAIV